MNAAHEILMAKSNHIFAWPFEFKVEEKNVENFSEPFEKRGWMRKSMNMTEKQGKLNPDLFMLNQYLSESARNIFIREREHICQVFEYPLQDGEKWEYLVQTRRESDCFIYRLPIVSVELHVYRHGVGILFLHLVNNDYTAIEDIKKINDLGRRISLPFLPNEPEGFILCADQLGIISKDFRCVTDFRKIAEEAMEETPKSPEGLWQPAGFLLGILNCRLGKEKNMPDIPDIESTSDDRMFLFCLIRDEKISQLAKNVREWKCPSDQRNEEWQKLFYSLIFVDPADATCQDAEMRSQLLEKAIYPRWAGYGTIYGVTEFSMVCLTGETQDIESGVLRPFIVEYTYLLSLVLAQRIGIALYSEQAGKIVRGVDEKGTIKKKKAKNLINLQEKYITFKNQMLILEASCQEQGIEMYHQMQNQLLVQEEQEILDEQLESLYEATNVSVGNFFEDKGIKLAVAAIAIDIAINLFVVWLEGCDLSFLHQWF